MIKSKKFIRKSIITAVLLILGIYSITKGSTSLITYCKAKGELSDVTAKINSPINNKKAVVDPISISSLLSNMQGVDSIDLIAKIDSTSLNYIADSSLSLEEIPKLKGINLIEISMTVNDMSLALESLKDSYLVYDFIDINSNNLIIRIYVKGD